MHIKKTLYHTERSTIFIIIMGGIIVCIFYIFFWFISTSPAAYSDFMQVYTKHNKETDQLIRKTFQYGSGNNQLRQNLNNILSQVMLRDIQDDDRYRLSRKGLGVLDDIKNKLNITMSQFQKLSAERDLLNNLYKQVRSPRDRNDLREFLDYTNNAYVKIERILNLLFAQNEQTRIIFMRIIEENGALTDNHIQEINAMTKDAEKNFNELSYAYTYLYKLKENNPSF